MPGGNGPPAVAVFGGALTSASSYRLAVGCRRPRRPCRPHDRSAHLFPTHPGVAGGYLFASSELSLKGLDMEGEAPVIRCRARQVERMDGRPVDSSGNPDEAGQF